MQLSLVTAMRSVTGPHRSDNQDSLGCSTEYVFIADGVGGHVGGDVASSTITHRLMAALASSSARALGPDELRARLAIANAELRLRTERDPHLTGMSTTFTGLFCADDAVRIVHIGDSRAYLVRGSRGRRMTRDDTLVQMLLDSGTITAADAPHHPQRNIILRSLAGEADDAERLTVRCVPGQVGDRWLVCSDGLSDYVLEEDLLALLAAASTPESAADTLIEAALAEDSHDNISVAVSEVVAAESAEPRSDRYLGAAADMGPMLDLSR